MESANHLRERNGALLGGHAVVCANSDFATTILAVPLLKAGSLSICTSSEPLPSSTLEMGNYPTVGG